MAKLKENHCFILMPFKKDFDGVYRAIKEELTELNVIFKRADDIYQPGKIIDDILENIEKSDFLIADLTKQNPNVFYELGYATALEKKVILINQENPEQTPFDLLGLRTIKYKNSYEGLKDLGENLERFIKNIDLKYKVIDRIIEASDEKTAQELSEEKKNTLVIYPEKSSKINQREKDNMVLEDLAKNMKEISGNNKVPIEELMDKKFMAENTKFSNFDEMLEKSNLEEKYNTFENISSSVEWNTFIQNNTNFDSWDDMKGKAAKSWAIKKLGL